MSGRQSGIFTNDRCIGCNRCVSACPLPEANYAVKENGTNKIYVNAEKCVCCGACLMACPHGARDYLDDTEHFLARLGSGKLSVVVSPAVRTSFPAYRNMLGLLRSMGVKYIYDASFGADICTWAYIRHIQSMGAAGLISHSCPVVISYIEKYASDLSPLLAPIQNPAVCAAIYMRHYLGIDGEIAFLSPCAAHKSEFDERGSGGFIQYNVTFSKLGEALKSRGVDYQKSSKSGFNGDEAGLGSIYTMPGGLGINLRRTIPDAWIYQISGRHASMLFLDGYRNLSGAERPFLTDILSCSGGCNMGTGAICGSGAELAASREMHLARGRAVPEKSGMFRKPQSPGKTLEELDRLLRPEDFIRHYIPRPVHTAYPSRQHMENAFQRLRKTSPESRRVNCGACGYDGCEAMACAVSMGINHVENCIDYTKILLEEQSEDIRALLGGRELPGSDLEEGLQNIVNALSQSSEKTGDTLRHVTEARGELAALREVVFRLGRTAEALREELSRCAELGGDLAGFSLSTRLLSKNAQVEAECVGEAGRGFSVISKELSRLSAQNSSLAKAFASGNGDMLSLLEEIRAYAEALRVHTERVSSRAKVALDSAGQIERLEQEAAGAAEHLLSKQTVRV